MSSARIVSEFLLGKIKAKAPYCAWCLSPTSEDDEEDEDEYSIMASSSSSLHLQQKRPKRRRCRNWLLSSLLLVAISPSVVGYLLVKRQQQILQAAEYQVMELITTNIAAIKSFSAAQQMPVKRIITANARDNQNSPEATASRSIPSCFDDIDNNASTSSCCSPWEINTDDWWSQHPQWDVSDQLTNDTHTCFHRIQDAQRLAFLEKIVSIQNTQDCSKILQKTQISSGYAAALTSVTRSFYAAIQAGKPFQYTKAHVNATWNFAPRDPQHWAYCETQDMHCYYLPILVQSHCPAIIGQNTAERGIKPSSSKQKLEFLWLRHYAFRLRHAVRFQLHQFQKKHQLHKQEPQKDCTAIHVRRGDVAFGRGRRYAAVQEYIEAGNVSRGETIVLLTDDMSTIEEVEKFHANKYRWIYLDRPRFRGSQGGFEGFVPSQDPAFEILAILAEIKLAGQCSKLVHGKSGFVAVIIDEMEMSGKPYTTIYLDTQQDKKQQEKLDPRERAEKYLQSIISTTQQQSARGNATR